jgi:hypothetical protein
MEWPDFLVCEPILQWPGDATPEHARTWSQFRAKMPTTVKELRHELEMLRAVRPVLRVGVRPRDVRQDGFPRADARLEHPGVILVFNREARSKEFTSRAAARDYLRRVAGAAPGATDKALYRLAAKATHPDVGGTQEEAARVTAAWALLTQADTFQLASTGPTTCARSRRRSTPSGRRGATASSKGTSSTPASSSWPLGPRREGHAGPAGARGAQGRRGAQAARLGRCRRSDGVAGAARQRRAGAVRRPGVRVDGPRVPEPGRAGAGPGRRVAHAAPGPRERSARAPLAAGAARASWQLPGGASDLGVASAVGVHGGGGAAVRAQLPRARRVAPADGAPAP